jgi:hypothetical protein
MFIDDYYVDYYGDYDGDYTEVAHDHDDDAYIDYF